MYPVIIQIGPIIIYSLWLFAGIAFVFGVYIFTYLAKMKRLNMNFIYSHSFSIFLIGLVFSRIVFVLKNLSLYFPDLNFQSFAQIFYVWDKGLSFTGALIGIILSIIYFSYREKEQTMKWLDILSISAISGLIIANIGKFLDGAAGHGNETNLPWGVLFESPSIKYAVPIHPTQIYAALYSLIIAVILFYLYKRKKYKAGKISLIAIFSYFSLLFLEGFVRGDDVLIFLGIREEQWLSLIILLITGSYLLYRYNKNKIKNPAHIKENA